MQILDAKKLTSQEVIDQTVKVLNQGGLVIFPTETTYGAGVDATNQQAVDKLLSYKSRREGKPLSIAVPDQQTASKYVQINEQAKKLYSRFIPGPITIVSESLDKVAPGVSSEFGTLGVRIPDYSLILDLLKEFGKPMTATSANASGKKRPYNIDDILNNLSEKQKNLIDLIIDAGELPHNEPSTVIDTTLSTPVIMRNGVKTHNYASLQNTNNAHLTTHTEQETKEIAGKLLLKHWNQVQDTGLTIGLNGPLGVGKTIFAKGAAQFLKIEDTITSPTYSYIEEYDYHRHQTQGRLYHLDLWKVDSQEIFNRLEIKDLIKPNNIILIEWWNQVEEFAHNSGIIADLIINFEEKENDRILEIVEK